MRKRVVLDFESRSRCDLKKSGAYKYSLDPSTQPTCLHLKVQGSDHHLFWPFELINLPWNEQGEYVEMCIQRFIREQYEFSAHNAMFEKCLWENILVKRYGWPTIPPRLWRCTAAKAAACALPRNLAGAGEAMDLKVQKDFRGYHAMMATCKPTKAWTAWNKTKIGPEPKVFLEREDAPDVWDTLEEYCRIDVLSEEELDSALPDLSPREQQVWHLNQEINWRGLQVDVRTVKKIIGMMQDETSKKLKELDNLTIGLVTKAGARNSILEFLKLDGVELPDLKAKTVQDKLNSDDLSEDTRRLLEIRKALSKTSTKKYQAFIDRANEDGRVRDILLYHGASTGRDAGTGIQPQNFPRGLLYVNPDDPYTAVRNIEKYDRELLEMVYGDSLSILFSSVLRNMIIPSPGCELFVGDYSVIEVACCWWLADNEAGLKVLREGKDPYLYQASANTGRPYESFTKHSPERALGKPQVLGCQFGMGWERFQSMARDVHGLYLSEPESRQAVQNYRIANPQVPQLWRNYEKAAIAAVESGELIKESRCEFEMSKGFLWVTLPSGRRLAYRKPQIAWRQNEYGNQKTLEFWAVNSKTKKWAIERTWGGTLVENITSAVARDILMDALLRLKVNRYVPLLAVHDEAICERPIGEGNLETFLKIMCHVSPWAKDIPVKAEGWVGPRYRK